jgi:hypothetical protein
MRISAIAWRGDRFDNPPPERILRRVMRGQRSTYFAFITLHRCKIMAMMKIFLTQKHLFAVALLLFAAAPMAMAQNIYKCVNNGQVTYTDHPCPNAKGELIHKADDADVIDQYLRLGQNKLAKQYADARHLEALYEQHLAAYQREMDEKADRQADEQIAAQQRQQQQQQQQAIADAAAHRERLRDENDALRQQNDAYRDQLAAPVYREPAPYWGEPGYGRDDYDHHRPRPPRRPGEAEPSEPVFHPCTQLAGGRVNC